MARLRQGEHGYSLKNRHGTRVMKDSLVTVFGGGGFLGRQVVQALLAQGARVRVA